MTLLLLIVAVVLLIASLIGWRDDNRLYFGLCQDKDQLINRLTESVDVERSQSRTFSRERDSARAELTELHEVLEMTTGQLNNEKALHADTTTQLKDAIDAALAMRESLRINLGVSRPNWKAFVRNLIEGVKTNA